MAVEEVIERFFVFVNHPVIEHRRGAVHRRLIVHFVIAEDRDFQVVIFLPAGLCMLHQRQLVYALAIAKHPPGKEIIEPEKIPGMLVAITLERIGDFLRKVVGDLLIGIDQHHPLIRERQVLERPLFFLRVFPVPVERDDLGPHFLGNLPGPVGAVGIDQPHLVEPLQRFKAQRDIGLFVQRDGDDGDGDFIGHGLSHGTVSTHYGVRQGHLHRPFRAWARCRPTNICREPVEFRSPPFQTRERGCREFALYSGPLCRYHRVQPGPLPLIRPPARY